MSEIGQKIISAVRKRAEDDPNFIYKPPNDGNNGCVYVSDGQPSCLIGCGLWDAGLIGPEFEGLETNRIGIAALEDGPCQQLNLILDEVEQIWIFRVQAYQDGGHTWGDALRLADEGRG